MSRVVAMDAPNRNGQDRSDRDVWNAVRRCDETAFRELFVRHSTAVYNFCFRRTSSWSPAEDAVQTTFATLWRRAIADSVDDLELDSAQPMLLAMARNECSNANRARARHLQLVDRIGATPQPAMDNTTTWVAAETAMRLIREALAVLPQHQRDVVELVAWAELSTAEAADVLKLPASTVKSRLVRARARLADTQIATLLGDAG